MQPYASYDQQMLNQQYNSQKCPIYSLCRLYSSPNWSKQALVRNSTELVKCTAWEYDMDDNLGNTWTSEWDLVCESEYLKNVAEMFFLVGVATGGIISGYLSDKFGRRTMLFASAVLQTIFGESFFFLFWTTFTHFGYNSNRITRNITMKKRIVKISKLFTRKKWSNLLR